MTIAPVLPFALVMSFTPGPNNLMLAASGARFGFRRTLPHQAGIVVGFAVMTVGVGLGIAALVAAVPALQWLLRAAGLAYLLVLAWRLATAEGARAPVAAPRPVGFVAAAAFQWSNPKAWIMTLTAVTTYTAISADPHRRILLLAAVFAAFGAASSASWAAFGQLLRRVLTSGRRRIAFNVTMAALLLASTVPALFESIG